MKIGLTIEDMHLAAKIVLDAANKADYSDDFDLYNNLLIKLNTIILHMKDTRIKKSAKKPSYFEAEQFNLTL